MQGSRYSDDDRERAKQLLASGKTITEVSKEMSIPFSTVNGWKKSFEDSENFEELRNEYKKKFDKQTSEIIDAGLSILKKRFKKAEKYEDELESLLREYADACRDDDEELSKEKLKALAGKISTMKIDDVSKISQVIGTLYDKRALSQGESTQNVNATLSFENMPI